ncbi:MAG: cytochrome C oxidase subunit IV family protein [Candidatus Sulfotelmatobacter sp.]
MKAGQVRGMGISILMYVVLLVIAALQFLMAFSSLTVHEMLVRMLILAFIEAAIGVLFFMHLWTEKRTFILFVLIGVFAIAAMQYGWTDSFRLVYCGEKCS